MLVGAFLQLIFASDLIVLDYAVFSTTRDLTLPDNCDSLVIDVNFIDTLIDMIFC